MGVIDGTELYHDAVKRIQKLEKVNLELAAERHRMRPVVDAACKWADSYDDGADDRALLQEVTEYYGRQAAYEASKPK